MMKKILFWQRMFALLMVAALLVFSGVSVGGKGVDFCGLGRVEGVAGGMEIAGTGDLAATLRLVPGVMEDGKLKVDVMVEDLGRPLFGVGFHLKFDRDQLRYVEFRPGEVLEAGGDQPIYLVKDITDAAGEIVVGVSLKRGDFLAENGGLLVSLMFEQIGKVALGDLSFDFGNPVVSGLENGVRQDFGAVKWEGFNVALDVGGAVSKGNFAWNWQSLSRYWLVVGVGFLLLVLLSQLLCIFWRGERPS